METIRHAFLIALKDTKRCAVIILAVLLASIFDSMSFLLLSPLEQASQSGAIFSLSSISHYLLWIVLLFALVPYVVQEDNPASFDAFTHTRPISKYAVAFGKLIVISLFGALIPSVLGILVLLHGDFPFSSVTAFFLKALGARLLVLLPASILASCFTTFVNYLSALILSFMGIKAAKFILVGEVLSSSPFTIASINVVSISLFCALLFYQFKRRSAVDSIFILGIALCALLVTQGLLRTSQYLVSEVTRHEIILPSASDASKVSLSSLLSSIRIERVQRNNSDNLDYYLIPTFKSPNLVVRAHINEFSLIEDTPISIPIKYMIGAPEADLCLTLDELKPLLDKTVQESDLGFNASYSCSRFGGFPIDAKIAHKLKSIGLAKVKGSGVFDLYSISTKFHLSDKIPTSDDDLRIKREYFNPFKHGYLHPQLVESGEFGAFEVKEENSSFYVFSLLKTALGTTSIEPLKRKDLYIGATLLSPFPLYRKSFYTTPFSKPELDFVNEGQSPDESSVFVVRSEKVGSEMHSFEATLPVKTNWDEQQ